MPQFPHGEHSPSLQQIINPTCSITGLILMFHCSFWLKGIKLWPSLFARGQYSLKTYHFVTVLLDCGTFCIHLLTLSQLLIFLSLPSLLIMELYKNIQNNYLSIEHKLQCRIIIGTTLRIIHYSLPFNLQVFSHPLSIPNSH